MNAAVLAVLGGLWAVFVAMWLRDRRRAAAMPRNKTKAFSSFIGALSTASASTHSARVQPAGAFSKPVNRLAASRRRRHGLTLAVLCAGLSFLAVPVFGVPALVVHVLADGAVLLFVSDALRRRRAVEQRLASVRVLYPRQSPSEAEVVSLRRIVNG